jgi:hypothetical protein
MATASQKRFNQRKASSLRPDRHCVSTSKPRLTFQAVPQPKDTKVRIHLDVQVEDIDAGREQVETLGGRWTGERHDYDEGVVLVMQDPGGNEFCLVQNFPGDTPPA